jgi:hypothetical protein
MASTSATSVVLVGVRRSMTLVRVRFGRSRIRSGNRVAFALSDLLLCGFYLICEKVVRLSGLSEIIHSFDAKWSGVRSFASEGPTSPGSATWYSKRCWFKAW